MPSGERNDAGSSPAEAEKAAPNALAITRETLAPLDAKEREMLMVLLNKLRRVRDQLRRTVSGRIWE
jgi:hypothetical protein